MINSLKKINFDNVILLGTKKGLRFKHHVKQN